MVLEPCSGTERANMVTVDEASVPYFYSYVPVIHELGVLILFTIFEADFFYDN